MLQSCTDAHFIETFVWFCIRFLQLINGPFRYTKSPFFDTKRKILFHLFIQPFSTPSEPKCCNCGSACLQIGSVKYSFRNLKQKGAFLVHSAISKPKFMYLVQRHHVLYTNLQNWPSQKIYRGSTASSYISVTRELLLLVANICMFGSRIKK